MAHTIAEVQTVLNAQGYGPIAVDGAAGPQTDAAVSKYQAAKGITVTGTLDDRTLSALFPISTMNDPGKPRTIQATFQDYILNLVKSKSTWLSLASATTIVAFLNTHFGLNLGPTETNAIAAIMAFGFTALIGVAQTFMNSPHMTNKQPAVVQQPAVMH